MTQQLSLSAVIAAAHAILQHEQDLRGLINAIPQVTPGFTHTGPEIFKALSDNPQLALQRDLAVAALNFLESVRAIHEQVTAE